VTPRVYGRSQEVVVPYRKTRKFSKAEILRAARRVANGERIDDICRELGISDSTFYRRQRQYGVDKQIRRERGRTYSMSDLRREMDLSRRGVASNIEDGLLNPPIGFGSSAHYREEHLVRLRVLALLKRAGVRRSDMPKFLARLTPAREKEIVRSAGKLAWGSPRIREWLRTHGGIFQNLRR
jgi:hypothetical protein